MKKIKKNLKWITLIIVIILIISLTMLKYYLIKDTTTDKNIQLNDTKLEIKEETIINEEEPQEIPITKFYVDIKGAVNNPGVYEVEENKKVIDVVELAGGLTSQADTSMINLAKKVNEQMVIIIYTKEEVRQATETNTVVKVIEKECVCPEIKNDACINNETISEKDMENKEILNDKININTATLEELLTISGIGESKAKAIIEYRKEFGNFKSIEDILNVSGIGETLYEKIKDSITI